MVLYKHMGDSASFRYGPKQSAGGSGLEFTSGKKSSRFAQYVQQFNQPQPLQPIPVQRPATVQQPTQRTQPTQQAMQPQQVYVDAHNQLQPLQQPMQQQYMQSAWEHVGAVQQQPAQYYGPPEEPMQDQVFGQYEAVESYELTNSTPSTPLLETYNFEDNQDNLGMEAPNVDELFGEAAAEPVAYKKVPQSHIVRPALDQKQRMSPLKVVFATLGVVLGLGIIGVSTLFLLQNRPAVSASIKQQAGFPVFDLAVSPTFKVDRSSVEINENNSLVYIVKKVGSEAKFIVSQQALPQVVKEDAQFQQFLAETDKFASMESKIGKAYFTRPANIGTDISLVVKNETTLLFIRGPGTTTEEDWSSLLAHLTL